MPGPKPRKGLSIRAYAAHRKKEGLLGGSPSAVQKALRDGRIQYVEGSSRNGIDPAAADKSWSDRTAPNRRSEHAAEKGRAHQTKRHAKRRERAAQAPASGPPEDSGPQGQAGDGGGEDGAGVPDYYQSRAMTEAFNARLKQMEYLEKSGQMVPLAAVEAAFRAVAGNVRDLLLTLPDRLGPMVAPVDDVAKCRTMLREDVESALRSLAADPAGLVRGQDKGKKS